MSAVVDLGRTPGAARRLSPWAVWLGALAPGLFGCGPGGNAQPVSTRYSAVSAGWDAHACALRDDGRVVCWGDAYGSGADQPPKETFVAVAVGGRFTCGITAAGPTRCWGSNTAGTLDVPAATLTQISAGGVHACGLTAAGEAHCWGVGTTLSECAWGKGIVCGQADPPDTIFASISAGEYHTCGVSEAGSVSCWGAGKVEGGNCNASPAHNDPLECSQARPPAIPMRAVDAGGWQSCGITMDNGVVCWGSALSSAPAGTYAAVSAGIGTQACAIRGDGTVACWSDSDSGAPGGSFVAISVGHVYTCGIRSTDELVCWRPGGIEAGDPLE